MPLISIDLFDGDELLLESEDLKEVDATNWNHMVEYNYRSWEMRVMRHRDGRVFVVAHEISADSAPSLRGVSVPAKSTVEQLLSAVDRVASQTPIHASMVSDMKRRLVERSPFQEQSE